MRQVSNQGLVPEKRPEIPPACPPLVQALMQVRCMVVVGGVKERRPRIPRARSIEGGSPQRVSPLEVGKEHFGDGAATGGCHARREGRVMLPRNLVI